MPINKPLARHEVDAVPRPVTFRISEYENAHTVEPHHHQRAQLLFAVQGIMRVTTKLGIWVVPPHRAVWIPPRLVHAVEAKGPLRLHNLYFDPQRCPRLPSHCCVVTITPLLRELIVQAVKMPLLYEENGPDGRLIQVLIDQITTLPETPLNLPLPKDTRLKNITNVLQSTPCDNRSLEEWGHIVGASSRTLARLFVKETGFTFAQWRQQTRLLHALEQLALGKPVAHVAEQLGYDNQSAFIAMFKKATGKTPGKFFTP